MSPSNHQHDYIRWILSRRLVRLIGLLAACVLFTACGESDGPSLHSAGGDGSGTPPGFLTFTNGMAADIVIGQPNFFSNSTSCTSAHFSDLRDTFWGASGTVWVADGGNARVLAFNTLPTTSGASFDCAIGQLNPSSCINNGTANDQLEEAEGVAQSETQLFVADGASNRRV